MSNCRLYTNADENRTALAFFNHSARASSLARLACPFFTSLYPLTVLKTAGVERIDLIVRLCYATLPSTLESALQLPGVSIRYFSGDKFHAKFYILADAALLGSANLTRTGLEENHEIAISVEKGDLIYSELGAYFDTLWSQARPLAPPTLRHFGAWHTSCVGMVPEDYIAGQLPENAQLPTETDTQDEDISLNGKSLAEIAVEQLRELGQPKSTKEIYNAVVAKGFVVPVRKARKRDKPIFDALLMRERKVGGVFRTRDRKWNLDEWCSPEEVTRLKEEHVRADDEHLERTRRGIEKARQQGKQIGARPLIDGETRERVMQMFRANMTKAAIARAIGVSVATINNNFPGVRQALKAAGVITGPARRSREGKQTYHDAKS